MQLFVLTIVYTCLAFSRRSHKLLENSVLKIHEIAYSYYIKLYLVKHSNIQFFNFATLLVIRNLVFKSFMDQQEHMHWKNASSKLRLHIFPNSLLRYQLPEDRQ